MNKKINLMSNQMHLFRYSKINYIEKNKLYFKLYIKMVNGIRKISSIFQITKMNKEEGAQCSASLVKIEEPIYESTEKRPEQIKQESSYRRKDQDQLFSRESEANWNAGDDNQSMRSFRSTSTNKSKRPPNQDDLCNAILTLRKQFPQRSLEQIIIRLHQSVNHKKKMDAMSNASKMHRNYEPSICSRRDDFDDSQNFGGNFSFNENFFENIRDQDFSRQFIEGDHSNSLKYNQSHRLKQNESLHNKRVKENYDPDSNPYGMHNPQQNYIPQAGANYIYKPAGQQVVVQYLMRNTLKVNFINVEEETRYTERRVMAKSFIERGYGVSECRKEIEAQNLTIQMHRNTYKTLAGSVIILAFRKLESFIANQCKKTIKFLDRWQMRSICTTMLNCRANMDKEQIDTLFKYIKAGYGLEDVTIGQIQSVKLYLAIQKNIHGKNVTMETLELIGEIQQKKNIELTRQYLNRKRLKRQQRLQKLRKLRIQVKQQKIKEKDIHKEQTFKILNQIELNHPLLKLESDGDGVSSQDNGNNPSAMEEESRREPSVSHASVSQADYAESRQQLSWRQQFDQQFVNIYLQCKDMLTAITTLQERHEQLVNWSIELFQRKFCKIIKKSIKKVQMQSQMSEDPGLPVLNKLDKEQMKKLLYSPNAQNIRNELLAYFVLEEPNLEMLIEVVVATNIFFYGFAQGGQAGDKKRGRGRPPLQYKRQIKRQSPYTLNNQQKVNFTYQPLSYTEQNPDSINFEQQFSIGEEQLRRTLFGDEEPSQENMDLDLDLDTNDLRLELGDSDLSVTQANNQVQKISQSSQVKIQNDGSTNINKSYQ